MALPSPRTVEKELESHLAALCVSEYRWERLKLPPVHVQFQQQAAAAPSNPCLLLEGKVLNFGDTAAAVRSLTQQISNEIPKRSHIGVYIPKSFEYVVSSLAVLNADCIYVPLDPALPLGRLKSCATGAELSVVLTIAGDIENAKEIATASGPQCKVITVSPVDELKAIAPPQPDAFDTTPAKEISAYIMFTSGTTGQPKGVVCTHLGLADAIADHCERLASGPGTTFELTHSVSFDAHLYPLFCPLVSGSAMALCRPGGQVDPPYWIDFLAKSNVDFVHSVPTPSAAYVEELRGRSPSERAPLQVREWDCIGEPFPAGLAMSLGELLPKMADSPGCINAYGPTESTIAVTHSRVPISGTDTVTVGRPDPNVHCYVVDPVHLLPLPVGEKGELLLSGPRLALEYFREHVKTATAFVANPCAVWALGKIPEQYRRYYTRAYRTGDLAQWLPNGELQIHGRIDRQVKIRGVRFELGEVEATLQSAPGVTNASAAVRQDPRANPGPTGKRLIAWVMPETLDIGAVLAHCASVLMPAAVPIAIIPMASFPTSSSGKVDEKSLPDPAVWHEIEASSELEEEEEEEVLADSENGPVVDPKIEAAIAIAWQEALALNRKLGRNADFFMEGGTSLTALRANAAVCEALGLAIPPPVSLLYRTRTLRATAIAIEEFQRSNSGASNASAEPIMRASSLTRRRWVDNVRPLTPGQEQFWLLDSLARGDENSAAYVVPVAFKLTGPVNIPALERALHCVAARHESLRMRYATMSDGSIRGIVAPPTGFRLPLKQKSVANEGDALESALRTEQRKPFELETGPLIRAVLFSLPDNTSKVLCISTHHSISDNWSIAVLCKELTAFYAAEVHEESGSTDPAPPLPVPLPIQYGDYAEALSKFLSTAKRSQIKFWRETLAGAPELINLPIDHPRPPVLPIDGASFFAEPLSPELRAGIHRLAGEMRTTHAALYFAAFHTLMARLSGQEDVVVGLVVAQRYLPQVQGLIGNLINPLPVRTAVNPKAPFSEVAGKVQEAMAAAMEHDELPLQELVLALGMSAGGAYNPIFQVMFQLLNDPPLDLNLGKDVAITPLRNPDLNAAPMELFMEVNAVDGAIMFEYSTVLFDKGTAHMVVEGYRQLLESVVANANCLVQDLNILGTEQRKELEMFSAGHERQELLHGPLVHETFRSNAGAKPDARCLICQGQELTYGEVARAVDALSAQITAAGCSKGSVVGVVIGRSFELVVAMMATLQNGCVYLPLDPGYPIGRLAGYVEDAKPAVVLISEESAACAQEILATASFSNGQKAPPLLPVSLAALKDSPETTVFTPPKLDAHDSSAIIFTSGSTGTPKGVELTHRGLRDLVGSSYRDLLGATAQDVYTLVASIGFDPHLGNTLGALTTGAALAIVPAGGETDAGAVSALCVSAQVTIFEQVPSLMTYYIPEFAKVADKLHLRAVLMGGETLPPSLAAALQTAVPALKNGVYNTYGPTEFTVNSTTMLMADGCPSAPLGPPDPNVRAYVVDPEDISRLQPPGVPGELLLSGPRLAKGYLGHPSLTAERFPANPFLREGASKFEAALYGRVYRTGDLVRWDNEGALCYLGRSDRQVKVSGVRIELTEVEAALLAGADVTSASVVAIASNDGSKSLVGVVTPATADISAAMARCREVLMAAAVPSTVLPVAAIPLLPSGKVNSKAVEDLVTNSLGSYANGITANGNSHGKNDWYVPPANDLESTIVRSWQQVLGYEEDEISVELDFFRAGGNSLKAGVLMAGLRKTLGLPNLPATAVYQAKTVRGMAKVVEKLRKDAAAASVAGGTASGASKFLNRIDSKASSTGEASSPWPRADDPHLELLASQTVGSTRLPYWAYLIIQYLMLSTTMLIVPIIWGGMLVALFELRPIVGIWALVGIWPLMHGLGSLLGYAVLLIGMKWIMVQRLKPGVYPLYGWMWTRWITLRALQTQAGVILFPPLRRTPLMPLLLRALGADIESLSDTVIDSMSIFDADLLTIRKGACIYARSSLTASFVTPAGYLGPKPMLVLSPVVIGRGCHLGHRSVISGGTTIPDYHNLKPAASPCHPGDAPVAGPLADYPHFTPEERMSWPLSLLCGLVVRMLNSVIEIPSIALCLFIVYWSLGDVPLVTHTEGNEIAKLVLFSVLFTAVFTFLKYPIGMVLHSIVVVLWKWLTLGRLTPGRDMTKNTHTLLSYSILRRLVEDPHWDDAQSVLTGTPLMGALYRLLGAKIGKQVLIGGLTIVEFDALTVDDYGCSGSGTKIYATDDDGIITAVKLRTEATLGNCAVLFPSTVIGERAVVGNDTAICMSRVVPADTRVQGGIEYTVVRKGTGTGTDADLDSLESGLDLPDVVKHSAGGVEAIDLPWGHTLASITVLVCTARIGYILLWVPVAIIATLLKATYWYLIFIGYPAMGAVGVVISIAWYRLMFEVSGIRKLMKAGSGSVFDIRVQVIHGNFNPVMARLDVWLGTPFAVWMWRGLGFKVANGAVLMGPYPNEPPLISIGANSVIEAGSRLDGHYLEFLRIIYHKVEVGEGCWVQEGARVMPSTVMKDGSRVLPASMVLPGDTLEERMIWCGLPAEPIGQRNDRESKLSHRRNLGRSFRIDGRAHKVGTSKGMGGFLGGLASNKQIAASHKL